MNTISCLLNSIFRGLKPLLPDFIADRISHIALSLFSRNPHSEIRNILRPYLNTMLAKVTAEPPPGSSDCR